LLKEQHGSTNFATLDHIRSKLKQLIKIIQSITVEITTIGHLSVFRLTAQGIQALNLISVMVRQMRIVNMIVVLKIFSA